MSNKPVFLGINFFSKLRENFVKRTTSSQVIAKFCVMKLITGFHYKPASEVFIVVRVICNGESCLVLNEWLCCFALTSVQTWTVPVAGGTARCNANFPSAILSTAFVAHYSWNQRTDNVPLIGDFIEQSSISIGLSLFIHNLINHAIVNLSTLLVSLNSFLLLLSALFAGYDFMHLNLNFSCI